MSKAGGKFAVALLTAMIAALIAIAPDRTATASDATDPFRLAQAAQVERDSKVTKDQRKTSGAPAETVSANTKNNRKRGRLPDLTTMCEVQPPCPANCREDIKKNICIENTTP